MGNQQRILRTGAAAVAAAVLLRLLSGFSGEAAAELLLCLGTARPVCQAEPWEAPAPPEESTAPEPTEPGEPEYPVFTPADAAFVEVGNFCGYPADIPALLEKPLHWQLRGEVPTVLIFHTHATESYENREHYRETGLCHTLDQRYNMVSVGEALAKALTARGIRVIHDRTVHDYPSYNNAYPLARKTLEAYVRDCPGLCLMIDLHRDAADAPGGGQLALTARVGEQELAQLMLVVGTDAGGLHHPDWEENLALAVKLQARLEKHCPGLCRPLAFRRQRYNQDLFPGALLIEVGAAGNTREQALASMEPLARCIAALSAEGES